MQYCIIQQLIVAPVTLLGLLRLSHKTTNDVLTSILVILVYCQYLAVLATLLAVTEERIDIKLDLYGVIYQCYCDEPA